MPCGVFPVLVVPELGSHPKLFTADSLVEDLVQGGADAVLVAVNRGAIQVPVSSQDGALDGCRYFLRRGVIGTEGPQSHSRHKGAAIQPSPRHQRWSKALEQNFV